MAHIHKFHRNPKDKLGLIARPEVAVELGLKADDARTLYPMALACTLVNEFRHRQMNVAGIELAGFPRFLELVQGEYSESHLEEWEVHQAFEIILQYLRDPEKALHFVADTAANMRAMQRVKHDMGIH